MPSRRHGPASTGCFNDLGMQRAGAFSEHIPLVHADCRYSEDLVAEEHMQYVFCHDMLCSSAFLICLGAA